MKIFISWSGNRSKAAAEAVRDFLGQVLQALQPFVSSKDVGPGIPWADRLITELSESRYGIICVTADNLSSQWLLFEAGALERERLYPLLLDIKPSSLEGPLSLYQCVLPTREGLRRLVEDLNVALGEEKISDEILQAAFRDAWPRLEKKLSQLPPPNASDGPTAVRQKQNVARSKSLWILGTIAIGIVVSIILAIGVLFLSRPVTSDPCNDVNYHPIDEAVLDRLFRGNWFCFPDDTWDRIGIKRIPDSFTVQKPLKRVDHRERVGKRGYKCGQTIQYNEEQEGIRGGTGVLMGNLELDQCPKKQQDAIATWVNTRAARPSALNDLELNNLFDPGTWECHPTFPFAVIVDLTDQAEQLPIQYPITAIDSHDGFKYGVGESVGPGGKVTVWLGGNVTRCRGAHSFWRSPWPWSALIAILVVVFTVLSYWRKRGERVGRIT